MDVKELVADLRRLVTGEVRFDKMSRVLYSTDASIYQIEPIGVVIPKTPEDVIAVVETANRYNVPVLPRGGGTSLAGQTVGRAIVMDFSRYMREVLEVNAEEGWARVQPGIILDELNQKIAHTKMAFTPDPSTSNRGNVGGALGNNSCGSHSMVYGKSVDNVIAMNVVLANGDTAHFAPLDREGIALKKLASGFEGDIYRKMFEIGESHRDEVIKRYPKIQRRVSGYNLDEFLDPNAFNMARFVVGSEGTLITITEAKVKITKKPSFKGLAVIHFNDLIESMEATVAALELKPDAIEHIGSMILRNTRNNLTYSRLTDFLEGDPDSILATEFSGESEAEVESKLDACEERMRKAGMGYFVRKLTKPADQAKVWEVRKAGLGLMMNAPGPRRPLPFVEDTAVSPEKLPQFIKRFDEIVREHDTIAGYYGHASTGCMHIRPLIDLKLQEGVDRMVSIADKISDLVLEYGGSMSGEHGDGLVRSVWNKKMFGPKIYDAFREVKRTFDPKGLMNPGKIVDSPPMTENLRIGPKYRPVELRTGFTFAKDGNFASAIEMCNGQGACRKVTSGIMCPSYMVTRDEEHSTRGRANALRAAISGALPMDSLASERLYEVMDLCIECKGCKAECPSNVDMAKLKYEFLDRYHKTNGYPVRNRVFGNIDQLSKMGSFFAPISNWSMKAPFVKEMLQSYAGVDKRRTLPPFANQTFTQWFRARGGSPETAQTRGQVVIFPDTFTNFNHPELGRAAVKVAKALGYQVLVPGTRCCGRPMLSKGMVDKAKANARANVDLLLPYISRRAKMIAIEPSCASAFKDDYLDLLGNDPVAKQVGESTMLIEEFVVHAKEKDGATLPFKAGLGKVMMHGHCHQKALVGTKKAMDVLKSIPGAEATEIQSGCCGMAGAFGFEKEHYDISMQMGEKSLFGAVRAQEGDVTFVTEGISCRQQIHDGTGKRARHLVEVLADAL
ncbi:MAG: anaerobic glycerol-3-phosphate dehydrogenase subunit C [SAR202 cluster bacterium]|nr:anaerobic glycerol-3-phosphate dehydrogenase subunit C [SAR202 cluster bacterium]